MNKHTIKGTCNICRKEAQCWVSNDENNYYDEDLDTDEIGTGLICVKCAKENHYERCGACGDMRAPENLEYLDPVRYTNYHGYCPGCFDDLEI